jgi:hypothetical protein
MAQFLFDASSAYLRIVFRVYFTALLLLLGLIGNQCCAEQVKLRLYHNRRRHHSDDRVAEWSEYGVGSMVIPSYPSGLA